jgi:hypothetical protein
MIEFQTSNCIQRGLYRPRHFAANIGENKTKQLTKQVQ